jgi:aryl-alcohol dehydrogenase-like predicted oxidoreductase
MASRRNRDRLLLVGKGGHPYPVVRPNRLGANDLAGDLHASLRRLGTDRFDLYLLHRDHPTMPLEPILEALLGHQRAGKIGAFGVSNWTHARVAALDALARSAGSRVAASSPHFSLAEWDFDPYGGCVSIAGDAGADARAFYTRSQMPVLAWSPLCGGYFSDRSAQAYESAANGVRRRRAERLAYERGVDLVTIVLAYLFHQPFPVFPVVSVSSAEHARSCLAAEKCELSEAEVAWLSDGDGPSNRKAV